MIGRKLHCLNPNPQWCNRTPAATRLYTQCPQERIVRLSRSAPSAWPGRWRATPFKGMSGTPTSRSTRSAPTERGIAYGARAPRRRSLRSSPRAGKPPTWRRETGGSDGQRRRYARCGTPKRSWDHPRTWQTRTAAGGRLSTTVQPDLYLRAYGRIYRNAGAMTQASTAETVDGMSLAKIDAHHRRCSARSATGGPRCGGRTSPRRIGKLRPLGYPDLVGQAAARSDPLPPGGVLRAAVQPTTPTASGPAAAATPPCGRSPQHWTGTKWFIEGDISECFDSIDHPVLLAILSEKLHDDRFLRLIEQPAQGRISGGLELSRHPQRHAARRGDQPDPLQHLP